MTYKGQARAWEGPSEGAAGVPDFTMRSRRSLSFCMALLSSAICLSLALSSLIC